MNVQLSKRENNILLYLLTNSNLITIKELADLFEMSIRTLKYDLDNIRLWLVERDYELLSKRGKGIWIELADFQKLALKNEILKLEKIEFSYDQDVRIHKLIFQLFKATGFLTSEGLSHQLLVSKNTIGSDLDKVEEILCANELELIRQPRQGFRVSGAETAIRLTMEKIIQQEISEYDIYNIMSKLVKSDSKDKTHPVYLGFNQAFQKTYETILNSMTELIDADIFEKLNYSEILSITIRTAISVTRLTQNKTVGTYKIVSDQKQLSSKRDLPFLLIQTVYEKFELPILEDEYRYIYSDVFTAGDNLDTTKITENIVTYVSQKMNFPFDQDATLFTNLFAHLALRLSRKHLFINEYNPFVVDIKAKYPALYLAIKTASEQEINGAELIVNESFVAYLALHFLVTMEKYRDKDRLKVVYVCSTGLGVTSLIQQRIKDELPELEIISFASILNIREVIQGCLPDLIISIFPIENVTVPWIKVNPIPTIEDMKKIQLKSHQLLKGEHPTGKVSLKVRNKSQSSLTMEDESREIIVKGFVVFEGLKELLEEKMEKDYLDSFLLHVFLMVHRITFDSQYLNESIRKEKIIEQNQELVFKIEAIFAKNQLAVNQSEIIALLQYMKKGSVGNNESV